MVQLREYINEQDSMTRLIKEFWICHNGVNQTDGDALWDLKEWTKEGHKLYIIRYEDENVGFVHIGSRGAEADWLEDIFVRPEYQNRGIGSAAIDLIEKIVKEYSITLYIEVAAKNQRAIQLYSKLGYDCLNTITIRKDFDKTKLTCVRKEEIYNNSFEIRSTDQ